MREERADLHALSTLTAAVLKRGCFETGSQSVIVSSFAARGGPSGPAPSLDVPVAVVEGDEDDALARAADPCRHDDRAAGRGDANHVSFGDPEPLGIGWEQLRPGRRGRRLQLGCAARLRAGVEVVDGAAGRERERVLAARPLVRCCPLGGLEDRAAVGAERPEVGLGERCAGDDVVAVVLAELRQRREREVGVEPLRPLGRRVVARPLDAGAAAQLRRSSAPCSRRGGRACIPSRPRSTPPASTTSRAAARPCPSGPAGGRSRRRSPRPASPARADRPPARRGGRCGRCS